MKNHVFQQFLELILGSKNQYQCAKELCISQRREFDNLQFNQHHIPVQNDNTRWRSFLLFRNG